MPTPARPLAAALDTFSVLNRAHRRAFSRAFTRRRRPTAPLLRTQLPLPRHRARAASTAALNAPTSRLRNVVYGTATVFALAFGYLYITDTRASIHQWFVVPALRLVHADPEDAHHAGIRYVRGLYGVGLHPRERGDLDRKLGDLQVEVFGHVLDNPVGTSAGIDKNADIPDALFALGPAIVEVGGATPHPQPGNPMPRVFRIPSQNALINRYGLNSEGAEHVAMQLRERVRQFAYENGLGLEAESERIVLDGEAEVPPGSLHPGRLLAVNIAKNKTTPDGDVQAVASDYVRCVQELGKYADILVVNVSSPNTPGLRDLQAAGPLTAILSAVVDAAKATPRKTKPAVMVKVSPDEDSEAQMEGICSAVWSSGVDGVIVGNTTKKRPDPLPVGYVLPAKEEKLLAEVGGYSGPQLFGQTLSLVQRYRQKLDQGPPDDGPAPAVQQDEKGRPPPPLSTPATASMAPSSAEPAPEDASLQRDMQHLKPLTPAAKADSTSEPIVKLPERHNDPNLESSGQTFEPSTVSSPATAIAPPPSDATSASTKTEPASSAAPYASIGPTTPPPSVSADSKSSKPSERGGAKDFEPKVIFATGGITNGEQCLQILNAGASVCQIYTAMMYGGVGTVTRIKEEMRREMRARGEKKA